MSVERSRKKRKLYLSDPTIEIPRRTISRLRHSTPLSDLSENDTSNSKVDSVNSSSFTDETVSSYDDELDASTGIVRCVHAYTVPEFR